MSYPSFPHVSPVVDPRSNGHATSNRTVDWTGYPTLFQRTSERPTRTTIQADPEPRARSQAGRDIREAFLGYCQAMLLTPESAGRFDRPSERSAAADALSAAESFGFTREELRRIGCGLYPGAAAVREHLRGVGFSDAEIDAAMLIRDTAGRPRSELAGNLIVPLADRHGRTRDYLLVAIDPRHVAFTSYRYLFGTAPHEITAHGLQAALSRPASRGSLLLVENVLEGLLLQCRGLHSVVAIGGGGRDFSPRRWEELARLGISTVTLAFCQNERHSENVRDALVNALRARTAPEVHVACDYPAAEESPLDLLRRFGRETCAAAFANRTLAFHQKDFGTELESAEPDLEIPIRGEIEEPHYRAAFRQHLADLIAALPAEHRSGHQQRVAAADEAIRQSDWDRLRRLVGGTELTESWESRLGESIAQCERSASTFASATAVLERLGAKIRSATRFQWTSDGMTRDGSSAIEWLAHESPQERLEALCDRILDLCQRNLEHRMVIACGEHTDQEIMLALTRQLAARKADGVAPTIEEVRHRLGGFESWFSDPRTRLAIDEAVDRLRGWSHRLNFVTCGDSHSPAEEIERALEETVGSTGSAALFLDGVETLNWHRRSGSDQLAWIPMLSQHFDGPIYATAAVTASDPPSADFHDIPASETQIQGVLADWEQRERETARV